VDCRVDEAIPVWSRQFCCHDFHEVGFAGPDFFFFFREICFVTWTDEYHHDADWESDDADWESDDANLADEARASDWAIDCACDRGIDCVCDRGIDCVYDMAIDYVFDRGTYFVFEMPETGHGHVCKKVTGHVWEVTGHDDGKATALCFVDKEIFADCYTTGHGHGRDQGSARVTRHDDGIPTELLTVSHAFCSPGPLSPPSPSAPRRPHPPHYHYDHSLSSPPFSLPPHSYQRFSPS